MLDSGHRGGVGTAAKILDHRRLRVLPDNAVPLLAPRPTLDGAGPVPSQPPLILRRQLLCYRSVEQHVPKACVKIGLVSAAVQLDQFVHHVVEFVFAQGAFDSLGRVHGGEDQQPVERGERTLASRVILLGFSLFPGKRRRRLGHRLRGLLQFGVRPLRRRCQQCLKPDPSLLPGWRSPKPEHQQIDGGRLQPVVLGDPLRGSTDHLIAGVHLFDGFDPSVLVAHTQGVEKPRHHGQLPRNVVALQEPDRDGGVGQRYTAHRRDDLRLRPFENCGRTEIPCFGHDSVQVPPGGWCASEVGPGRRLAFPWVQRIPQTDTAEPPGTHDQPFQTRRDFRLQVATPLHVPPTTC